MARPLIATSHHRHTGKPLPHHHTSWAGLTMVLVLFGMLLAALSLSSALAATTLSGMMAITSTVSGPPPGSAPTLTQPDGSDHLTNTEVTLGGSCQSGLTVVITSNEISRGSVSCDSTGHFQIHITLITGRNELVATQYDTLDQASPASNAILLFYEPPAQPTTTQQSTSTTPRKSLAAPATKALSLTTNNHYQGTTAGAEFRLVASVQGGYAPYAINIDWGDTQATLLSLDAARRFEATHTYSGGGTYIVTIRTTDITGAAAVYQTTVSILGAPEAPRAVLVPPSEGSLVVAWPIYGAMLILVFGFWLGEQYAIQRRPSDPSQPQTT